MIWTMTPTVTSTAARKSGVPVKVAITTLRTSARGVSGSAASPPITRINGLAGSTRTVGKARTESQMAMMTASGANPRKLAAKPPSPSFAAGPAEGLVGPHHHVNQISAAAASGSDSANSGLDTLVQGMLTPSAINIAGTFIG